MQALRLRCGCWIVSIGAPSCDVASITRYAVSNLLRLCWRGISTVRCSLRSVSPRFERNASSHLSSRSRGSQKPAPADSRMGDETNTHESTLKEFSTRLFFKVTSQAKRSAGLPFTTTVSMNAIISFTRPDTRTIPYTSCESSCACTHQHRFPHSAHPARKNKK